jgi:hypothetical protein
MKKQQFKTKLVPNVVIETQIESINRYAKALTSAIETNNETLINNNVNLLRMVLDNYDLARFGSKELPF